MVGSLYLPVLVLVFGLVQTLLKMIEVIHEHSVDISLLPAKATILDLGCRGFAFTNYFRELGHTVHAVDIDDLQHGDYDQCAITNYTGMCGITNTGDPQGTKIGPGDSIRCYTLEDYMKLKGVEFYDLVKVDIEGGEYEMIMDLDFSPAQQISIEMHRHCGQSDLEIFNIVWRLNLLGYEAQKHELTSEHGAGLNFWDSLFILK